MSQDEDINNILNLEFSLKEKMNELQWKSKMLEESQRELLKVRQKLLNKEIEFEDNQRTINDLNMQLTSSHKIIDWLEKEKTKCMNERIQLQINCDVALKERESLLEQTHAAKLENLTLKLSVQQLTETVAAKESIIKGLETSLLEMQDRFLQVNSSFQSNVAKLEKEHWLLQKSVESTINLNKRLQIVGLCTHAIYTNKNEKIKELQKEISMTIQANNELQTNEGLSNRNKIHEFDAKTYIEQVRLDLEKYVAADKEVESFLNEFENDE